MEDENSMFLMEEALEMILVFNEEGVVSYANAAARKKLGYEEEPGSGSGLAAVREPMSVWPMTFWRRSIWAGRSVR